MRDNAGARLAGRFALCGVLANGLLASLAAGQCTYDVTVIQAPACPSGGHPPTIGLALNEHSHVVGYQLPCGFGGDRAFLWTPEGGYELLPLPPEAMSMRANDINDSGMIVGTMHMFDLGDRGFVYDPATQDYTILHPVFPDSGWSQAHALNQAGIVAGERSITPEVSPRNAFLWSAEGGFTDLGVLDGPNSAALDISKNETIGGWTGSNFLDNHAVVGPQRFLIVLPPVPGGTTSMARAISEDRRVVGSGLVPHKGFTFGVTRAFSFHGEALHLLPNLDGFLMSSATDVRSDADQIVGASSHFEGDPNVSAGVIWHHGSVTDLNELLDAPSDVSILAARGINASGCITGQGRDYQGDVVAFVLKPTSGPLGDLNSDCEVGLQDLLALLVEWGPCGSKELCLADLDEDGAVTVGDLMILLSNWGS